MKLLRRIFLISLLISSINSFGQQINTDTLSTQNNEQTEQLLPQHYIPTQKLIWGEKGLIRNIPGFELNKEQREQEQQIRRIMITAHQYTGYATLAGMLAQGFVGAKLYNGDTSLRGAHEALAGYVNFTYFTTAGLALFAPPRMKNRHGYSNAKLHQYLSIIHLTSMIATNILAGQLEGGDPTVKTWHRATAYTAFGSFFVSMLVIKF